MRVLLIGSGGREHALAQSLKRDPKLTKLFVAPGNPGISDLAECLEIDIQNISERSKVGNNIVDYFTFRYRLETKGKYDLLKHLLAKAFNLYLASLLFL